MNQQMTKNNFDKNTKIIRKKFFSEEEIYLLNFLKDFDRQTLKEWEKLGLWNSY